MTAEQTGFKTTYQAGIGLAAGARVTVNLNLEVGTAAETVEVHGSIEAVNTTSGELATHIDSQQVQKAALNQRNYAQLVSLIPGAWRFRWMPSTCSIGLIWAIRRPASEAALGKLLR